MIPNLLGSMLSSGLFVLSILLRKHPRPRPFKGQTAMAFGRRCDSATLIGKELGREQGPVRHRERRRTNGALL